MSQDNLKTKLKDQIEFYFSDANFRRDKFLLAETKKDPEGYIPLKVLTTFKRVSNLTSDLSIISEALKDSDIVSLKLPESSSSPLSPQELELIKIKKAQPLPEQDDSPNRTLYIKGFPETLSLDEIISFFKKQNINVLVVRMNRAQNKNFKGSCWLELKTPEEAQVVRQQTLKWDDSTPLSILTREEKFAEKEAKQAAKKRKEPTFTPNVVVKVIETKKSDGEEKPSETPKEEKSKEEGAEAAEGDTENGHEEKEKETDLSKYVHEVLSKSDFKAEYNELEDAVECSEPAHATQLVKYISENPSIESVSSSTFTARILSGDEEAEEEEEMIKRAIRTKNKPKHGETITKRFCNE
eukprot:TRINITY_DN2295_c0_g2_i1.p1 TRINITY_DN2295_c0_g2~~TRINITY_DN2295_c0_g2_i1.p1  ORF type:complete len:380 (-),score=117.71 TRINITY_DN2295_c0_g2_i1:4-1065(-)